RYATTRVPTTLMTDTERRAAVVTDARLQEQLVIQVECGLSEVAFQATLRFRIARHRTRRRIGKLERLRRDERQTGDVDLAEERFVQVLTHRERTENVVILLPRRRRTQVRIDQAIIELPTLQLATRRA